jgi:Antitoxin VbhA
MPSLITDHPSITVEERALRLRAINQARASVRLEGTVLPVEIEELNRQYVDGELTTSQHVEKVIETADAIAKMRVSSKRLSAES